MATAIVVLFGVAIVWAMIRDDQNERSKPPPTPAEIAEKARSETRFLKTSIAAKAVKDASLEPDSVVWELIIANDDATIVCMTYRTKNSYGGMSRENVLFVKGKPSQSVATWNKHCTKPLFDMLHVRHAL